MQPIKPTTLQRALACLRRAPGFLFNETVALHGAYQELLNAWDQYAQDVPFTDDPRSVLPHAKSYFDLEGKELQAIILAMRPLLRAAKRAGDDIADPDIRQAAFSDALTEVFEHHYCGTDRRRKRVWDAYAVVDEAAYQGLVQWSAVAGKRRELEHAVRVTRRG